MDILFVPTWNVKVQLYYMKVKIIIMPYETDSMKVAIPSILFS